MIDLCACRVAAGAGVLPLTQNVRGVIFKMAGMRGVSCYPEGRRYQHLFLLHTAVVAIVLIRHSPL
jgi:hypothetical protein